MSRTKLTSYVRNIQKLSNPSYSYLQAGREAVDSYFPLGGRAAQKCKHKIANHNTQIRQTKSEHPHTKT